MKTYPAYPADLHAQLVVKRRRHASRSPKSWPVSPVPDLDPYFSPSVPPKVLAKHSATETGSSDPYQSEKEQTKFAPVLPMTGTELAQNPGIHASMGSPASYVQANGNQIMSSALVGPVPGALVGHKSSVSFPNSKKADPPTSSHRHSHPEYPVRPPSLSLWQELSQL